MIKKVNLKNLEEMLASSRRNVEPKIKGQLQRDKVEIRKTSEQIDIDVVTDFLKEVDLKKFISDLQEHQAWTDSVNFIGFRIKNDKLFDVRAGLFDTDISDIITRPLTLEKFKNILTVVTTNNIIKKPKNETEYKKQYLSIINYINKNAYKE